MKERERGRKRGRGGGKEHVLKDLLKMSFYRERRNIENH